MIVCAGNIETFDFATPIGIGLIESTMNLTRIALMDAPEKILFVGTAGSYGKYKPFDIVYSTLGANVEISFLEKKSYTPIDNVIDVSYETSEPVMVNSSNYITTSSPMSNKFLKLGMELENMEFFSVLSIAKEFDIPVMGVFIVTNYCDEHAHDDFVKNHAEAMAKLSTYIKETKFTKGFSS